MAQSRAHVDKAIADVTRGRIAAVRAAGGCARLRVYLACGLRALGKSDIEAAALASEHPMEADAADEEGDQEIEVTDCSQHTDGRGLLRMDDSILMVVGKNSCILQADDEGETVQVQFDRSNGAEQVTWMCGSDLQVNLRDKATIVHLGPKVHVVIEDEMQRTTVIYDEGPVQQVTLTDDGKAGVRLRAKEQDSQDITLEQAKSRRAEVVALRDEVKTSMPSVEEALTAAEGMLARAKQAHEAAIKREEAFRAARAKAASKEAGDGPVDVKLDDEFIGRVTGTRLELVQLPAEFGSAQVQWKSDDGSWDWGCSGGMVTMRADGAALIKLTEEDASKMTTKAKLAIFQFMPTGDRLAGFEDGSRIQLIKDGGRSFHRGPLNLVLAEDCHFTQEGIRSRLEDSGDFIQEDETSGLSWALKNDELVVLSAGHAVAAKPKDEKPPDDKPKQTAARKKEKEIDLGQPGLVEDATSQEPLESASILAKALSTSSSGFSVTCTSGQDGRFDLKRSEDVVVLAEKAGFAPDMVRINAINLAFCLRLLPLSASHTFQAESGTKFAHEDWSIQVRPGAVKTSDGSQYAGEGQLDVCVPADSEASRIFVAIKDPASASNKPPMDSRVRIVLKTSATLRAGAPFPSVSTFDVDAACQPLPTAKRKSFLFRSVFTLPGCYCDLETCAVISLEVKASARPMLQREYQGAGEGIASSLEEPRLRVDHTARELTVHGIVEILGDDKVPEVTPLLLAEAKKQGPLFSALEKCKIHLMKGEVRVRTTYEAVVDWESSCLFVDDIEIPAVDEDALMKAHAEVHLVQSLKSKAATLSRASSLVKEVEAASKLKAVPGVFASLASAALSLFADDKKTAEQVGGFNVFSKQVKQGMLGRCSSLDPYELSEAVIKRTKQLAKFDEAKLQSDYPAAALFAAWIRELLSCIEGLHDLGVSCKDKKRGCKAQRDFLDVGSPVPALTALLEQPKQQHRLLEFAAPATGWWTVDFDAWRAAGGGAAAAKALA